MKWRRKIGWILALGAVVMAIATILQAWLLYSGSITVAELTWNTTFAGQAAEVTRAGVLVVNGVHVDANFSALYAATWIFLVLAHRAEPWFGAAADGAVVGLLVVQLLLAASKGAVLAVILGGLAVVALSLSNRRVWRSGGLVVCAAAAATVLVAGLITVAVDAADGDSDLASNLEIRADQVTGELGRFTDLVAIVIPDASNGADGGEGGAEDRAAIWLEYGRAFRDAPVTGMGYGVLADGYSYAHNAVMEAAAGGGIAGIAGWVLLVVGLGALSVHNTRTDPRSIPIVGALVVVLVGSLVLTSNYEPVLGLVIGLTVIPHLHDDALVRDPTS